MTGIQQIKHRFFDVCMHITRAIPTWVFLLIQSSSVVLVGGYWALLGRATANCGLAGIPMVSRFDWPGFFVVALCLCFLLGALLGAYFLGKGKKSLALLLTATGYLVWGSIYLGTKLI